MILFAITIAVLQLFKYDVDRLSYLWSIIPIIPSIINLVAFKNYLYIKLIIINIFVLLPLCIIHYISLNIWIEVAIIIGFLITSIVVCRLIKFNKENENGKI